MDEMKVLTRFVDTPAQHQIDTYINNGGYRAIQKAKSSIKPDDLIEMVKQSELRGRGGAGFMTGTKWGFVPKDRALTKYVVCNADESEPGTLRQ